MLGKLGGGIRASAVALADLDGNGSLDLAMSERSRDWAMVLFNRTITVTIIPGDIDGDGVVGILDFLLLLAAWGPCADCSTPQACPADLNGDCEVGIQDLLILLANWGT